MLSHKGKRSFTLTEAAPFPCPVERSALAPCSPIAINLRSLAHSKSPSPRVRKLADPSPRQAGAGTEERDLGLETAEILKLIAMPSSPVPQDLALNYD